jgi:hypothetical protein
MRRKKMLKLTNGATVHAAYILPESPGMKAHGVVLAETPTDWVTWDISWDSQNDLPFSSGYWDAESGTYFQKVSYPDNEARRLAYLNFGQRVARLLNIFILTGIRNTVGT